MTDPLIDAKTLARSKEAEARWKTDYERLVARFGDQATERATAATTDSGLPIKPCYFPNDVAHIPFEEIGAPGLYPFTRGNLPAHYQLMQWANQPVIGYGLPEQTRARMDLLAEKGMVGYFGQRFYNLVYDLVSHEGLDPDHPAARGRIGQCGMAVYSVDDMERLFQGLDFTKMNVVHITYYQVIPALAQYIAYAERRGVAKSDLRGNSMNWYHQSAYVGMSAFPPEQGLKLATELVSFCTKHMPRWNTTNFFCYGIEEAGGTAVQEIGLMLAFGIELVEACRKAGLELRKALGGGPRLFIKRDDYTVVGFGGNKIRKLEYVLGGSVAEGTEIEYYRHGEIQSRENNSGDMRPSRIALHPLVLNPATPETVPQNFNPASRFICETLGAEIHSVDSYEARAPADEAIAASCGRKGNGL